MPVQEAVKEFSIVISYIISGLYEKKLKEKILDQLFREYLSTRQTTQKEYRYQLWRDCELLSIWLVEYFRRLYKQADGGKTVLPDSLQRGTEGKAFTRASSKDHEGFIGSYELYERRWSHRVQSCEGSEQERFYIYFSQCVWILMIFPTPWPNKTRKMNGG